MNDEEIDEFEFFLEKGWSDGLPVVTPTEARVAAMLSGTRRDPDEIVGAVPPAMEPATVRTVAIHADRKTSFFSSATRAWAPCLWVVALWRRRLLSGSTTSIHQ